MLKLRFSSLVTIIPLTASLLLGCSLSSHEDVSDAAAGYAGSGGSGGSGYDAGPDAPPAKPGPMRVVSWNCFNFFDNIPNNCDGCKYADVLTSSEFSKKVSGIAKGLHKLDGDIVLLQEVENMNVLDTLAESSELASDGYAYRKLLPGNDPRGINIGVLSRRPIDRYVSHRSDKFTRVDAPHLVYRFARDAVEIHLNYNGQHVAIVGVHFKAKIDDTDPDRRIAEGQHAREIADNIAKADPNAYVFIAGDFNDEPGTKTYLAVKNGQNGPVYIHALQDMPKSELYSYTYGSKKLLIDHMLFEPGIAKRENIASETILHDKSLPSDHSPIAATFTIP